MTRPWWHMPEPRKRILWRALRPCLIAACCVLVACTATGGLFSSIRGDGGNRGAGSESTLDTQGLGVYLQLMSDLVEGDAVTQAEAFEAVRRENLSSPTTTNRLKLALALAIPGHPNSNDEHAERELRELLAQSELLLPEERVLAAIELREVENRMVLDLQARETESEAEEAIQRQNSDATQRIQELESENRTLQNKLEEVQATLEELTKIERSIRERESGPN